MSIQQMREWVSQMYDNDAWRAKVQRMPEAQVMAIYFRSQEEAREK